MTKRRFQNTMSGLPSKNLFEECASTPNFLSVLISNFSGRVPDRLFPLPVSEALRDAGWRLPYCGVKETIVLYTRAGVVAIFAIAAKRPSAVSKLAASRGAVRERLALNFTSLTSRGTGQSTDGMSSTS